MESNIECQLEALSSDLADLYFQKRDYMRLADSLSDNIIWIGTGQNEICANKQETLQFFDKLEHVFIGHFEIEEPKYKAFALSEDIVMVIALFNIASPKDDSMHRSGPLRFTILWEKEQEAWKVVHVHNSITEISLENGDHVSVEAAKKSYRNLSAQLKKASNTDTLTGINNVNGFVDDVERLLKQKPYHHYAIIKFGIRNFRFINRNYGYSTGDEVLKNIAKNLVSCCHKEETCARIEKDVFAMCFQFKSKEELNRRMDEIRPKLLDIDIQKTFEKHLTYFAGIYIPSGKKEYVIDMLDKALMAQQSIPKTTVGNQYVYYDDWMLEKQFHKNKLWDAIEPAINHQEFQVYIQPQYDIHNNHLIAGEALCRWVKQNGTIIPPDQFIPLLEENGMILSFDFYMLEELCKIMRSWLDQGLEVVPISINQSGLHIGQDNYINDFCSVVDKYAIPHHLISFELTESTFIQKQDEMMQAASHLHKLGFLLAIDDFGTGFASLNQLSVISADILKIDKSLLDDVKDNMRARSVIKKVIELAHDIDMIVICEGIESNAQLNYLEQIGCDIGQGFLLGKPMHYKTFTEYLRFNEAVVT